MPQLTLDGPIALQAELLLRLIIAVILGGIIGYERELGRHAAGLRTHMLVTLGSAAFTIAGTFGVLGLGTVQDPGRVAAQIVTGIGFLGAGTIWRSSQPGGQGVIYGLTTAASIWVAAAVGMLAGFGLYVAGAGTAIIGLLVLRGFLRLEAVAQRRHRLRPHSPHASAPPVGARRPAAPSLAPKVRRQPPQRRDLPTTHGRPASAAGTTKDVTGVASATGASGPVTPPRPAKWHDESATHDGSPGDDRRP